MEKGVVQVEGEAHHEDTAKADKRAKKIQLPEKTYAALEKKAKAEGKTPDEKAAEIVEKKAKAKSKVQYPVKAKINKYGFIHIDRFIAEDFGLKFGKEHGKDVDVEINRSGDNQLIITLSKA